jgi:26S proteasome regulatory subunit N2
LLTSLLNDAKKGDANKALLGYQIAFDLVEGGTQDYIEAVRSGLPTVSATADASDPSNRLQQILSGEESINLYLDFLKRNNHVDLLILKNTKESLDPRSSVYHTALTLSNAFMHAGTSSDIFLRENLDWLGRASNWSKFSATAGLGVIHKGNFKDGMTLLGPYLPTEANAAAQGSSSYSEGGALYALGLINAGRGKDVLPFLRDKLQSIYGEVVQHGAALGLGVAGIASNDQRSSISFST